MKISILLAVYNGEKYLRQSIESILDQTHKDFEVLIGLNGTTDNSRQIAKFFQKKDKRVKVFDYRGDKGKPKTLNKLLKEANGEWIAIQDDDDIWLVYKLQKQIKNTKNYDVVGTQIMYIDEDGRCPTKYGSGPLLATDNKKICKLTKSYHNQIANSSVLIKKSSLENVGGWDESLPALEDLDLWVRMIKENNKFTNIDEILVMHRVHEESNFNQKKWDPTELFSSK